MRYRSFNETNRGNAEMTNANPKMSIVWSVLESAKDNSDAVIIAACRRLIVANRLGWKKHADAADFRMVQEFYAS